ncbi:hypothetical protein [Streptomyces sp. 6N106]|uniref:hypothetical protein n=1 Tax=Streptomyces sp. 6N106 TaxID=3457418 RepID=UPI003FD12909
MFASIDSRVEVPLVSLALKVVSATVLVAIVVEFARFSAIYFWSSTRVRVERRARVSGLLKSARKVGADHRFPGWREAVPMSRLDVASHNPVRAYHLARTRRLVRQVPARRFSAMAARRSRVASLAEYPMRAARALCNRPLVVLFATFLVYEHERPGLLLSDLGSALGNLPQVAEQRTWIPVLVLVIGLVAATRSSPLVDRVRARDEAAKDTNRLLTELLAYLSELQVAVSACNERLSSYRTSYFDEVCRSNLTGIRWNPPRGLGKEHLIWPTILDKELATAEFERSEAALDATHEHLKSIRDKGLSSVAFRILAPVSASLRTCGFHLPLYFVDKDVTSATAISPLGFGWLMRRAETIQRPVMQLLENQEVCRADALLVEESYRLDDLILKRHINELELRRLCTFLRKRIHGTTLTRLLGGAGAK